MPDNDDDYYNNDYNHNNDRKIYDPPLPSSSYINSEGDGGIWWKLV